MSMRGITALASKAPATATPGSLPGVPAAKGLMTLRAVFGQDEANHGTARFLVDGEGLIEVPVEAVFPLTATGGFVITRSDDAAMPVGILKLHHDDAGGCSYAGCRYRPDSNGDVRVPAEAVSELSAHGFVPVFEGEVAPAKRVKSPSGNRSKKG